MSLTQKIAIAAGALTLGVAGVAAASTTPDAADSGLTKASEQVGIESSDSTASEDATSDEVGESENGEGIGPVDNHGAVVSAVAQTEFDSGRQHGEDVSEAARGEDGAEVSDDDEATDDDAAADDEDEATDEAAEQSTLGADNAGEHGSP